MLQPVTTVFAASNLGRIFRVYQSGKEVRLSGCRRGRGGDGGGDFLPVHDRLREYQLDLGGLRGMLDGANCMSAIVADKLIGSVDDHLWRVRTVHMQSPAVLVLSLRILV